MSGEGVVAGVGAAGGGKRGDEDGLQRDEDLTETRLLHQALQHLKVHTYTESGAVPIHLTLTQRQKQTHYYGKPNVP